MDDIVLIQASGVEHDSAIQDLKVDTLRRKIHLGDWLSPLR